MEGKLPRREFDAREEAKECLSRPVEKEGSVECDECDGKKDDCRSEDEGTGRAFVDWLSVIVVIVVVSMSFLIGEACLEL